MALQHLRSSTANKRPTPAAMADGQLAINSNTASPGLFFKDSAGALIKVGPVHVGTTAPNASPASGGATGNTVGEQWLDTTGGTYVFKVWDGSAWRSESGTFVDVNGDTMTGALGIIAGSASAPGLFFSGDTNTGIYSPGLDQVAVSTGGNERLRITSNGLVGIATSSPNERLSVEVNGTANRAVEIYNGDTALSDGEIAHAIRFTQNDASAPNTTHASIETVATGSSGLLNLVFKARDNTEYMRINTSGNVGIGTTSPGSALTVSGDIEIVGGNKTLKNSSGFLQIGTTSNDYLAFIANNSEKARIDTSGRLLVGTSTSVEVAGRNQGIQTVSSAYTVNTIVSTIDNTEPGILAFGKARGGSTASIVQNNDKLGRIAFAGYDGTDYDSVGAFITAEVDGTPGANDMPGRLVFSTTADGASSPTERMRITSSGDLLLGSTPPSSNGRFTLNVAASGNNAIAVRNTASTADHWTLFIGSNATTAGWNGAATINYCSRDTGTGRSINAAGTINASGADYAEYMTKAGDFTLAKGAICGVTDTGLLTLDYSDAVSFVVKSTNPSYVGGDTWGNSNAVGEKPGKDENGEIDQAALLQWEADLETARQAVDRIAFAGQVPVNVTGATPGQYIVPIEAADGGIEGVAKNESDLTLAEYMRSVGKVIAIEDDGRARIIVKVA